MVRFTTRVLHAIYTLAKWDDEDGIRWYSVTLFETVERHGRTDEANMKFGNQRLGEQLNIMHAHGMCSSKCLVCQMHISSAQQCCLRVS